MVKCFADFCQFLGTRCWQRNCFFFSIVIKSVTQDTGSTSLFVGVVVVVVVLLSLFYYFFMTIFFCCGYTTLVTLRTPVLFIYTIV